MWSADTRSLNELEEINHTLCLHPLHHGVDTDECSRTAHPITAQVHRWKKGKKKERRKNERLNLHVHTCIYILCVCLYSCVLNTCFVFRKYYEEAVFVCVCVCVWDRRGRVYIRTYLQMTVMALFPVVCWVLVKFSMSLMRMEGVILPFSGQAVRWYCTRLNEVVFWEKWRQMAPSVAK